MPKSRILIKIAGTWEGIQAVNQLEAWAKKINADITLSVTQFDDYGVKSFLDKSNIKFKLSYNKFYKIMLLNKN